MHINFSRIYFRRNEKILTVKIFQSMVLHLMFLACIQLLACGHINARHWRYKCTCMCKVTNIH